MGSLIDAVRRGILGTLFCWGALFAQPGLNLVFYGDSLTQGLPHLNGETDTYPFKVGQQFTGSTYAKLGYHGQPTDYLLVHLDSFLFGLIDTSAAANILVLWAGTNDCALGPIDCVQPAYTRLTYIARAARGAGWKVVAVTMIARNGWFADAAHRQQFPANQTALNNLLLNSTEFDAVADPSQILSDASSSYYYSDGTHLWPSGYQIVADLVTQAIQQLLAGSPRPANVVTHQKPDY